MTIVTFFPKRKDLGFSPCIKKSWAAVARKGGPRGRMSGFLYGPIHEAMPILFGVFAKVGIL